MPKRTKGRGNGEGSIDEYPKRSGKWFAQISLEDGRSIRRRADSQREAREKLRQLQAEIAQGLNLTLQQPTVAEWCGSWLQTFAPNLRPNIKEDYQGVVKRYIESAPIGRRRLEKLTPADVQAWVNDLAKQVAPQTVRNAHARLHKALEVAVRNNYIARNVASRTELPPVPKPEIHPLNFVQTLALLAVVEGHRWGALYRLAINLGMREGELLGLTWPAIDFERGTIRIFQQLRRVKVKDDPGGARVFVLQTTKTKAGGRTLKLDDDLLDVLRSHQAQQAEEQTVLGENWKDPWGNLVFTSETGAPIHASCLLDHFRAMLKAAQLPTIRFHDLRHTAATLMLANGVPLVTVSKILGHSSPAVTAQIYAHALDESKAEAIAALSQQLRRDGAGITHTITHTPPTKNPVPHDRKRGIPHCEAGAGDGTRTRTGLPPTVFKFDLWPSTAVHRRLSWRSDAIVKSTTSTVVCHYQLAWLQIGYMKTTLLRDLNWQFFA
jgi:integrase